MPASSGLFYGDSMDRQIVYPGQILPETSLLQMTKDSMIGSAKLAAATLGTNTIVNGFGVVPTGPASLQVVCTAGEIYASVAIDATTFSTLPADNTHVITKQGLLLDSVNLSCPAPGTTGQSIAYLIQVGYQDYDSAPVLLPYYNSANPALPYSGMGNNGLTQNTARKGIAVVSAKAGASATTGSQVAPSPDSGCVGLYVVTVAFGQTTITSGNISLYVLAPLLPSGLVRAIQFGTMEFSAAVGTTNAYFAAYTPAITAPSNGLTLRFMANAANTGAATFSPNGFTAKPILNIAQSALAGGEIVANGMCYVTYSSVLDSWILTSSSGGNGTGGRFVNVQVFSSAGTFTYTPTAGTIRVVVECLGGGGAGAGAPATTTAVGSLGASGGAGAYAMSLIGSGFSGASVVVGAGGTGVSGASGNAGGTSSFAAILSCPGGKGGNIAGPSSGAFIALAGNSNGPSGGNIKNNSGQGSDLSICFSATSLQAGRGGASLFGPGAAPAGTGTNGIAAVSPGTGGGGTANLASSSALTGGAGSTGVVVVWEYA